MEPKGVIVVSSSSSSSSSSCGSHCDDVEFLSDPDFTLSGSELYVTDTSVEMSDGTAVDDSLDKSKVPRSNDNDDNVQTEYKVENPCRTRDFVVSPSVSDYTSSSDTQQRFMDYFKEGGVLQDSCEEPVSKGDKNVALSMFGPALEPGEASTSRTNDSYCVSNLRNNSQRSDKNDFGLETSGDDCNPSLIRGARRSKVYCFYCETEVGQFARHIYRNHATEFEVQKILSYKRTSVQRKRLLSVIRNKGNFLLYRQKNEVRAVRKAAIRGSNAIRLPCPLCYGFFVKKQLWRHVKKCPGRNENPNALKYSQNLSHNVLLGSVKGNEYLNQLVFPRMRSDAVSGLVKTDPLICAFGQRYAKTHTESHQVNVISRKMRELGKLVYEMKKEDPTVKTLLDILRPHQYPLIVKCVKQIAKYDETTNRYISPTYAMNIQTSLKECALIACNQLYQRGTLRSKSSYDEAAFPFKQLVSLISTEWRVDVSHKAGKDLHSSTMNKTTIVPLAKDLHKFRMYLVQLAAKSLSTLTSDTTDVVAYVNLLETVYCRVMLLCRKRAGELSRMPLALYEQSTERNSYEEFAETITPSEMCLVRKFKRVVIHGKSKNTPVIFADDVQQHISILLKHRSNFISSNNPFLFAKPNTMNPIAGYKTLVTHARRAGLQQPDAITSRSLRKHLATVSQVFHMSDEDLEQLSSFLGHTSATHRKNYRLPDDVFQTAKISKILMTMERGEASKYKGKTLDEIDVDMDEDLTKNNDDDSMNVTEEFDDNPFDSLLHNETVLSGDDVLQPCTSSSTSTEQLQPTHRPVNDGKVKTFERVTWTPEEKKLVLDYFKEHVVRSTTPTRRECTAFLAKFQKHFKGRTWQKVKVFIYNHNKRLKNLNV